jgi:hypothetical protein
MGRTRQLQKQKKYKLSRIYLNPHLKSATTTGKRSTRKMHSSTQFSLKSTTIHIQSSPPVTVAFLGLAFAGGLNSQPILNYNPIPPYHPRTPTHLAQFKSPNPKSLAPTLAQNRQRKRVDMSF